MTKLLIVRHGQSEANVAHVFAGHLDVPLTPLGHLQAERNADFLTRHYAIDCIYSSDLKRAMETAEHTAARLGLSVTPTAALREIAAGAWEDKTFETLAQEYPTDFGKWLADIGEAVCTGGESVRAVAARVTAAMTEIAAANDGKTVLIATHALPVRVFQCFVQGVAASGMKEVPWVSNASVTEADFADGHFRLVAVGMDAHLADCRTVLPRNV